MPGCLILTYIIDKRRFRDLQRALCAEVWTLQRNACTCRSHNIDLFQSHSNPLWNHIFNLLFMTRGDGMKSWGEMETRNQTDGGRGSKKWWRDDGERKMRKQAVMWEREREVVLNERFPPEKTKMVFNWAKYILNYTFHSLRSKWLDGGWY